MSASRYVALATQTTSYARKMMRLRNRIFGDVVRHTDYENPAPKNVKIVQLLSKLPVQYDSEFVHYYPRHLEIYSLMMKLRYYGLFRDEHQDFKEEMKRLRELRGKVRPRKGEGKRAMKKK